MWQSFIALPDGSVGCSPTGTDGMPNTDYTDFWTFNIRNGRIVPLKRLEKANQGDPHQTTLLPNGLLVISDDGGYLT